MKRREFLHPHISSRERTVSTNNCIWGSFPDEQIATMRDRLIDIACGAFQQEIASFNQCNGDKLQTIRARFQSLKTEKGSLETTMKAWSTLFMLKEPYKDLLRMDQMKQATWSSIPTDDFS